jgi:hypothetical protein
LLLRSTLLQLQPSLPDGTVACAASIPEAFGTLSVENMYLAGARLAIEATGNEVNVSGLPDGVHLVTP